MPSLKDINTAIGIYNCKTSFMWKKNTGTKSETNIKCAIRTKYIICHGLQTHSNSVSRLTWIVEIDFPASIVKILFFLVRVSDNC